MTYELTLPPQIEQRLATRALASGHDVVQLIQIAVVKFVGESAAPGEGEYTPETQQRRSEFRQRVRVTLPLVHCAPGTVISPTAEDLGDSLWN